MSAVRHHNPRTLSVLTPLAQALAEYRRLYAGMGQFKAARPGQESLTRSGVRLLATDLSWVGVT